ncbi:MAG: glycosyl hydrolase, partial [Bryobacteraceae bacterium]
VSAPTRMMVKRASIGDEGLVLDHYNPRALRVHLDAAGEKLWDAVRGTGFRSFWCDSLEVFQANWTPAFLDEFQRLRGYDLKPHLNLLFGDATPEAAEIRHDFWQTLSELGAENFLKPLQQWCHAKGVQAQVEPYGQPPVSLGGFRYVDLPVGEHYEWRMFNASRWASSGGHLFGKNVIGAEAWTWTGIPNRFGDTIEQLKLASDMHFVSGINSLMGISYVYTPGSADLPGWAPYWGPLINHTQTWWPYFPYFSRYVQRVSWILRQGRPVSDVALYLPADDVWAATPASSALNLYFGVKERLHGGRAPEFGLKNAMVGDTPVISTVINNGYSFDAIDSATLPHARIEAGRLKMGLGDYRVVVLPHLEGMPLADLRKLAAFVKQGGYVVATKRLPRLAYGWKTHKEDTAELQRLAKSMFDGRRAILVSDEREAFRQALLRCLAPDVQLEVPDHDVAFVHRNLPGEDYYFVANLGPHGKTLRTRFRAPGRRIELWDPMTGETGLAWDGTLRLDPFGSAIVRVSNGLPLPHRSVQRERQSIVLEADRWKVSFPESAAQGLGDWTSSAATRFFSGSATYTVEADLKPGSRVMLDLGEVREIAEVKVNGAPAGVAWKHPYRVDVSKQVREGRNLLEIKVTNLWINALLGMTEPDYSRLYARFGARFPAPAEWKQFKPYPSGLLGPVVVTIER